MPAEPLNLWKSQPFEPEIRDGRIWARGADDDKGQSMMQVKGFETALKLDLLKCNVKFIFEGEEEIGSPSLETFCREHKDLLKGRCDSGIRHQHGKCRNTVVDDWPAWFGLLGN